MQTPARRLLATGACHYPIVQAFNWIRSEEREQNRTLKLHETLLHKGNIGILEIKESYTILHKDYEMIAKYY